MRPAALRRGLGLVALVAVLCPLPTVLGQAPAKCPGETKRTRPDGWVELRSPDFADPELDLVDYAVLPFTPQILFATNGQTVERSMDGGCTWEEVYENYRKIGESVLIGTQPIVAIEVAPSMPGRLGSPIYLVRPENTTATILKSNDLGDTWDDTTVGLPVLSTVHRMRVSANARVAYLLAEAPAQNLAETNLYVTRDGGITWTSVFTAALDAQRFTDFALDPVDARVIWAWNEQALHRSVDSGVTFTQVRGVPTPVGVVDVQRFPPYMPSRVMAFHAERAEARRSTDGGATFRTVPSAGVVRSTANMYQLDALATASDDYVRIEAPGRLAAPIDLTPKDLTLTDLAFGLRGQLNLFGREGSNIYRRAILPTGQPAPVKLPPVNLRGPVIAEIKESVLRPKETALQLRPGETRTVRYQLDLAPTPTPLDVMFATDSTGSMSQAIASLREDFQDIINDLGKSGINVWFGVGDFKDYPTSSPGDYAWKRWREVGPVDDDLKDAIESIGTGGGNGLDSSLAASYQAATGEGHRAVPGQVDLPGNSEYYIEPGQGAEWRRDAAKVIVMAADVRSRDPDRDAGYPGPSYSKVIRTLNRLGIKQVGLAVGPNADEPDGDAPRATLERVSEGTQTLAPPGGTDCDDDREIDIEEGAPLVCSFHRERGGETSIAPAIVGLLRSLEDLQTVSFDFVGDTRVAQPKTALVFEDVNVKTPNFLAVDVTFRCDLATAGSVYHMTLRARAGERQVGEPAVATVACAVPLPPPREFPVPPIDPPAKLAAIAVAPLPPPPPAPVPQTQVNPNPNPNPQAQAQAGAAFEEEEAPQLAFAQVEITEEDVDLAMVGRESAEEQAARNLLWVALALTAAAGFAAERRFRARGAPATVGVRR